MTEVRILLLEENIWIRRCLTRCLETDLSAKGVKPTIYHARNAREAFVTVEQEKFHIAILNQNTPIPGSHIRDDEHISDYICRRFPQIKVLLKNHAFWVFYLSPNKHQVWPETDLAEVIFGLMPQKPQIRLVK